jgi:hypothetical protein
MARRSKRKTLKALSAFLALTVVGLVIAGVVQIRHDYLLTGTELIGWAFVPLALLLGFTLPVTCRSRGLTARRAVIMRMACFLVHQGFRSLDGKVYRTARLSSGRD